MASKAWIIRWVVVLFNKLLHRITARRPLTLTRIRSKICTSRRPRIVWRWRAFPTLTKDNGTTTSTTATNLRQEKVQLAGLNALKACQRLTIQVVYQRWIKACERLISNLIRLSQVSWTRRALQAQSLSSTSKRQSGPMLPKASNSRKVYLVQSTRKIWSLRLILNLCHIAITARKSPKRQFVIIIWMPVCTITVIQTQVLVQAKIRRRIDVWTSNWAPWQPLSKNVSKLNNEYFRPISCQINKKAS